MKIRAITNYIVDHFSDCGRVWLDDCLPLALKELYQFEELDALNCLDKVKGRVKIDLRSYMDEYRKKGVPPKIKLSDNEIVGKQRPKLVDEIYEALKNLEPFEFQRLCCVYVRDAMGYEVQEVKRRDRGADVIARREIPVVAQARRHLKKNIGKDELGLWIMKVGKHYSGAGFIVLSATMFTGPAKRHASNTYVTLIDGEQISYFLSKQGFSPSKLRDQLNAICRDCRNPKCELRP